MFLDSECKDPEKTHHEECALLEEDTTGKETNSLQTESFTDEESSLPDLVEVTLEPEEDTTRKLGDDDSQSQDISVVAMGEDHNEEVKEKAEEKVNGEVGEEDEKDETVTYNMDDVD